MKTKPIVVNIKIATLDLEQVLESYIALYQQRGVKLSENFATRTRDIWESKQGEIEQMAQNLHYDAVAVIPGNVRLQEFYEQMTQGYNPTWESDNFKACGSWSGIRSFQTEQDRIVLFHDCLELNEHSLIQPLLGQNLFQVSGLSETDLVKRIAKGKSFQGQVTVDGQQQTFDGLATEDYLAIQAERYLRTKEHFDAQTYSWLIRSYCGRLVPELLWNPVSGQLDACAGEPGDVSGFLAPRPAVVFV